MICAANGHQLALFEEVVVREDRVAQLDAASDAAMLPAKRVVGRGASFCARAGRPCSVAVRFEAVLGHLDRERPDQPQAARGVGAVEMPSQPSRFFGGLARSSRLG
jgi:hypothetical protein